MHQGLSAEKFRKKFGKSLEDFAAREIKKESGEWSSRAIRRGIWTFR